MPTRMNLDDNKAQGLRIGRKWRLEKQTWVPADNAVIDINMPPYLEVNPAGNVNLLLPAGAAANAGIMFLISNISANTVTLQSSAGAGFTTAIVLATLENTIVFCTGSTTAALSWRALGTALST